MERNLMVFVCKNSLSFISVKLILKVFNGIAVTVKYRVAVCICFDNLFNKLLLAECKIVHTEDHILCRYCYRSTV